MFKRNSLQSTVDNYSYSSQHIEDDLISKDENEFKKNQVILLGKLEQVKQQYRAQKALAEAKRSEYLQKRFDRLVFDSRKLRYILKKQQIENMYDLERVNRSIELKKQVLHFIEDEENALSRQIHQIENKQYHKQNSITRIFNTLFSSD